MSPDKEEARLYDKTGALEDVADVATTLLQFRRRRLAALRCEPLVDGHRDPLFEVARSGLEPASFALTPAEIVDNANLLARSGWLPWELRARFVNPSSVAA